MKKVYILAFMLFAMLNLKAQAPQAIPYQAVARDNSGNLIANQNISLRISIHEVTYNGVILYQETLAASTNEMGLISVNIGQGTPVIGTFSSINWGSGAKFSQVEFDPTGGNNYTDMGTQQLMSVPYAMYSAHSNDPGPAGATGATGATGANGTNGINGTNGATGATGANGVVPIATAGGTSDAITATYSPAITLADKTRCEFVASAANTTTNPTFNPNGLGANTITKRGGQPLVAGDIAGANAVYDLEYNAANSRWELMGALGIVPITEGGTGSSTKNFVDLTTTQTAAGAKTWSNAASFTSTLNVTQSSSTVSGIINNGNAATDALQAFNTAAPGTNVGNGITGITSQANGYGVLGRNNATVGGFGVEGFSPSNASTGFNIGVIGLASGNTNASIGVDGETNQSNMNAVRGIAYGTSSFSGGVQGINTSTVGGSVVTYGLIGQNNATQGSSGASHIAIWGSASGASFNAGLYCGIGNGESVLTSTNTVSSTAQLSRAWNGSMFTQCANTTATGGRIWWLSDGFNFYVNSTGSADYSEYFNTADQTLGVGEVVALDPDHANSVRRARPMDATTTVGIVSLGGTRLNDNNKGNRDQDPNSINVGFIGQVPVLITTENGNIKPGDALTLSTKYRGRAVKAIGACRIIGYATTHFPYIEGEKDYETDILGGDKQRLTNDHVMCYLNVGWYEPANTALNDGIEPSPVENWHATMTRLNATIVSPQKAEIEKREKMLNDDQKRRATGPMSIPAQSVNERKALPSSTIEK